MGLWESLLRPGKQVRVALLEPDESAFAGFLPEAHVTARREGVSGEVVKYGRYRGTLVVTLEHVDGTFGVYCASELEPLNPTLYRGLRVRITSLEHVGILSYVLSPRHLRERRCEGATGVLRCLARDYDHLWLVRHDDGSSAAYMDSEFKPTSRLEKEMNMTRGKKAASTVIWTFIVGLGIVVGILAGLALNNCSVPTPDSTGHIRATGCEADGAVTGCAPGQYALCVEGRFGYCCGAETRTADGGYNLATCPGLALPRAASLESSRLGMACAMNADCASLGTGAFCSGVVCTHFCASDVECGETGVCVDAEGMGMTPSSRRVCARGCTPTVGDAPSQCRVPGLRSDAIVLCTREGDASACVPLGVAP
jgi:hypothetical protein